MVNMGLIFFLFPFFGLPLVLTLLNIFFIFRLKYGKEKGRLRIVVDILIMTLGFFFSRVLFDEYFDYQTEPLPYDDERIGYTPLSFQHSQTIIFLVLVAILAFFILRFFKNKLPPIPMCLCLSALLIGVLLSIIYFVQIIKLFSGNANGYHSYLLLFPFNFVLCNIRLVWRCVSDELSRIASFDGNCENKIINSCEKFLTKGRTWLFVFFLMFPLMLVIVIILVLLGQAPDAAIRAFTQTSDWTFSANNWPHPGYEPPPEGSGGHYLCTVASHGSLNVVKPLRFGIRNGKRIVVNRQLCVANAFEQYIMEKSPRFHNVIRSFYDRYGYPL
jgi:hypothetical protein